MNKPLDKDYQKEYWEENANARGYKHPIVKFFVEQRIDWIKRYIDISSIKSAFDVGCGDGFSTYYFSQIIPRVEGGDIAENMLSKNPVDRKYLHVIDAEKLPQKDSSFDLVYTWEVLHHVPNPDIAVKEMARVSKEYVILFEPNRSNPLQFFFGLLNKQERGTLRSTKTYLETLCKDADLEIVASEFLGKIPPNKTPESMMPLMKKLSFSSTLFTGISIGVIAKKKQNHSRLSKKGKK